jgi:glycogen operon protein
MKSGYDDITWHGVRVGHPDWSLDSHTLAFMLCGKHARNGHHIDNYIYVALNMHWERHEFEIPRLPDGMIWHLFTNTALPSPEEICEPGSEPPLHDLHSYVLEERTVLILVGK